MYNNPTIINAEKTKRLNADVKKILLSDVDLAGKIIYALGGEINLPAFTQMVYRNSQRLTKKNVLKIIANHLKVSTEILTANVAHEIE